MLCQILSTRSAEAEAYPHSKRKDIEKKDKERKLTSTFNPCSRGIGAWTTGTGATNPFLCGPSTCCENVNLGQQLRTTTLAY